MIDYDRNISSLLLLESGTAWGRLNSLVGSFLGVRQENRVNLAGSSLMLHCGCQAGLSMGGGRSGGHSKLELLNLMPPVLSHPPSFHPSDPIGLNQMILEL